MYSILWRKKDDKCTQCTSVCVNIDTDTIKWTVTNFILVSSWLCLVKQNNISSGYNRSTKTCNENMMSFLFSIFSVLVWYSFRMLAYRIRHGRIKYRSVSHFKRMEGNGIELKRILRLKFRQSHNLFGVFLQCERSRLRAVWWWYNWVNIFPSKLMKMTIKSMKNKRNKTKKPQRQKITNTWNRCNVKHAWSFSFFRLVICVSVLAHLCWQNKRISSAQLYVAAAVFLLSKKWHTNVGQRWDIYLKMITTNHFTRTIIIHFSPFSFSVISVLTHIFNLFLTVAPHHSQTVCPQEIEQKI